MKCTVSVIFLLAALYFPVTSRAQLGWQSAATTVSYPGLLTGSSDITYSAIDGYGNFYICGEVAYDSLRFGSSTVYAGGVLAKLDTSGNFLWTLSMPGNNAPCEIALDPAGNVLMVGFYLDTVCHLGAITLSNTTGYEMYFIAKISGSGTVLWAENIAGRNFYFTETVPTSMGIDGMGNVYLSATLMGSSVLISATTILNDDITGAAHEALLIKLNTDGDLLWVKKIGRSTDPYATAVSVAGDVYLSGFAYTDSLNLGSIVLHDSVAGFSYFAKLDNGGVPLWAKINPVAPFTMVLGKHDDGSENGYLFMSALTFGTVVIGPDTISITGATRNTCVAKYDTAGDAIWAQAFNASYEFFPQALAVDYCGNIFVGAGAAGSTGFPLPPMTVQGHTLTFPTKLNDYVYIIELDSMGTYLNGLTLGSGGDDYFGVHPDNYGNFYFGGDFEEDTIFLAGDTIRAKDETFAWAKYRYQVETCATVPPYAGVSNTQPAIREITLYPNPTGYECTISSGSPFPAGSRAEIYDMTGRFLHDYALYGNSTIISVDNLPPGLYQCRIITSENNITERKLVVVK